MHIIPGLPLDTIRDLLLELKPHKSNDKYCLISGINFEKIYMILREVKSPSQLLSDFLACTRYSG